MMRSGLPPPEEARAALAALLDRLDYVNGPDAREVVQRLRDAIEALIEQARTDASP